MKPHKKPHNTSEVKVAFDECLYYVKAIEPSTNWRSPWTQTFAGAEAYAKWFCRQWADVGQKAKATVYYRNGNEVQTFTSP